VDEQAKVNANYYVGRLLPELIADCKYALPNGFILQKDGAPAHMARVTLSHDQQTGSYQSHSHTTEEDNA